MSKYKPSKKPFKPPIPAVATKPSSPLSRPAPSTNRMAAFIFLLGFLLYFQCGQFDFTLDDRIVVFENQLTTQGVSAIPEIFSKPYLYGSIVPDSKLYRPTSKSVFAICWSLTPGNPKLFHFVNILFFALTGMLLFLTLVKYIPGGPAIPLITSLFFVAHPVHTEVVCNIKSLDEILALLFFIGSLNLLHGYVRKQQIHLLAGSALFFFLAFISKESAIAFLAVYPLAAYYLKAGNKYNYLLTATMLLVAAAVFVIRSLILTGPDLNPLSISDNILVGAPDWLSRQATAVYLLGKYILLLLFPHPLVCDYSTKQLEPVGVASLPFMLSFVVLVAALAYAIIRFRERDWLAFGILFFFITFSVTSNFFFLGGTHFAERLAYAPSLGFCLAAAVALDRYIDPHKKQQTGVWFAAFRFRPVLSAIVAAVILLYGIKTIVHSPVWKNNIALFENGVKHSPKSYRMHLSLAQDLSDEKYIKQLPAAEQLRSYERAIQEAKASLQYYPDVDAYDMIGNIFYVTGRYDSALIYYVQGLKQLPDYENLNYHAGKALDKLERYQEAIPYLNKALAKNPKNDGVLYNLALSYTNMNDVDKGLEYFMRVIELRPNGPDAYHYVGLIYRAKGDLAKADAYLRKAQELGGPRP